jgi:hypothetical protein
LLEYSKERRGNGVVQFADFYLEDSMGQRTDIAFTGEQIDLVFKLKVSKPNLRKIHLEFSLRNSIGGLLTYLSSSYQNTYWEFPKSGYYVIRCTIPSFPFAPGRISVRGRLVDDHREEADVPLMPLRFISVQMGDFYGTTSSGFKGDVSCLIKGCWHLEEMETAP